MPADINKAYTWMIQTCNAPNIGYSQRYRNQQTINGITYYDCSSSINYALLNGGFETPSYAPQHNAFTTYTMPAELLRLGFTEVDSNGEYLPGDIGLSTSHTEMCYKGGNGKGVFMGAHTSNAPLDNQVSIGSSSGNVNYERSFPRLFRYGTGGASGYGSSLYVISALCGNAWRESTINPGLHQVGGTAFGLFQWDGSRKTNLLKWLSENGYEENSPDGQMKYLLVEDDWQGSFSGISSLTDFLTSDLTDISILTEAFMRCWERPGVPALDERIKVAMQCYDYIRQNAQNSNINTWYISNSYLTKTEYLNNAVLLYRFFSAGGGGGGTIGKRKTKMPIWMMIKYY